MQKSISFSFACLYCLLSISVAVPSNLSRTPPQGWMSWQTFRCATNCTAAPEACIDEDLYKEMGDALISTGLAAVGFNSIHLDDCIMDKSGRDPISNELQADPLRFPSGFKALGDYLHSKGLTMAMYTAESSSTCGGWPGSRGFEQLDAQTFAKWGAHEYTPIQPNACSNNGFAAKVCLQWDESLYNWRNKFSALFA